MTRFLSSTFFYLIAVIILAFSGPVGKHGNIFAVTYVFSFLCLWGIIHYFPKRWDSIKAFWPILLFCLILHTFFVWFPPSFDVNRYVWEGFLQIQGVNPYVMSPMNEALLHLRGDKMAVVWEHINHKDLTAAYPPVALLAFRLMAMIQPSPLFFKIVILVLDVAVLLPLSFIISRRGIPYKRLLWYGANPLLLVFIAGEGHFDSMMVFFLCLGVSGLLAKNNRIGFFCLGCAVLTKFFAIIAVPFLFRADNWKKGHWMLLPLISYLPFMDAGGALFQSLFSFGLDFHYNDGLTSLLRTFSGEYTVWLSVFILACGLTGTFLLIHDPIRSVFWALGWLLICLPTLHPWYLVVILPLAAIFSSAPWIYLSGAMAVTFSVLAIEYRTGQFQEIHWLKILEYTPFYFLLGWGLFRHSISVNGSFDPVRTIAAIIPTYNEQEQIAACMEALFSQPNISQVIVADGGSTDQTTAIAKKRGALVVPSPLGRGMQIKNGLALATADVVLIVHADCQLGSDSASRMIDALNHNASVLGGAFGMAFSSHNYRKKMLSLLNNIRARYFGISFGDQGQFFRMAALSRIGGFPAQLLMEDVELSFRLKEAGPQVFLPDGIHVSGRRWDIKAFFPSVFKVLHLFGVYLVERRFGSLDPLASRYYKQYYGYRKPKQL
jgi:glycosyl transferase family 2